MQLLKLPIDAVPDITNKQVQVNTVAPALGPLDMERLVTFPSKPRWLEYRVWKARARFRATVSAK